MAGSRWPEVRALLAWVVGSWLNPAGAVSGWEQVAGREQAAWEEPGDIHSTDQGTLSRGQPSQQGRQHQTKTQGTST